MDILKLAKRGLVILPIILILAGLDLQFVAIANRQALHIVSASVIIIGAGQMFILSAAAMIILRGQKN